MGQIHRGLMVVNEAGIFNRRTSSKEGQYRTLPAPASRRRTMKGSGRWGEYRSTSVRTRARPGGADSPPRNAVLLDVPEGGSH